MHQTAKSKLQSKGTSKNTSRCSTKRSSKKRSESVKIKSTMKGNTMNGKMKLSNINSRNVGKMKGKMKIGIPVLQFLDWINNLVC